jgi:hypothetical protein
MWHSVFDVRISARPKIASETLMDNGLFAPHRDNGALNFRDRGLLPRSSAGVLFCVLCRVMLCGG